MPPDLAISLAIQALQADGPALRDAAQSAPPGNTTLIEPLSERELEVLRLIGAGFSNTEIAQKLYLAMGTVKVHARNIYGKLGVGSRTQAIAQAHKLNLL